MADHKTERAFAAAVRKAVNRSVSKTDLRRRLEAIADKLVEQAMEGDASAVTEVANRLDGKAKQQLELQVDNRMTIVIGSGGISGVETDGPFCLVNGADAAALRGVPQDEQADDAPTLPPPEPYAA